MAYNQKSHVTKLVSYNLVNNVLTFVTPFLVIEVLIDPL